MLVALKVEKLVLPVSEGLAWRRRKNYSTMLIEGSRDRKVYFEKHEEGVDIMAKRD
jgi:hypothetical protein